MFQMKIRSRLSRNSLLLLVPIFAIGITVYVDSFIMTSNSEIKYHASKWNEFATDVERALKSSDNNSIHSLSHVYGIVVPHHIPTTIPKLASIYKKLSLSSTVKRFIVIGPDHIDASISAMTTSKNDFFTVFSKVETDKKLAEALESKGVLAIHEEPFEMEHSIGAQVLLISKIFPTAKILPIILRSDTTKQQAIDLGDILSREIDQETIVVASVDFSHYLGTTQARPIDTVSGNIIKNLDVQSAALVTADSSKSMVAFMEIMKNLNAFSTEDVTVLNTNNLMQNSDYTTGYVFGFWGT